MDLSYKQEVTVGGLVILGVVLFFVGTTWLSGRSVGPRGDLWQIEFHDVGNLKLSSVVKVSGVVVGKVEDIRLQDVGRVRVGVSLNRTIVPKVDAKAEIVSVGFVGDQAVNLMPGSASQPLPRDRVIMGSQAAGLSALAEQLGGKADTVLGNFRELTNAETQQQLRQTMKSLQQTLAAAERTMRVYGDPNRGPTAELTRTMASLRRVGERLDSTLANPALARTLSRSDTLTGNLAETTKQLGAMTARLDTLLSGVNQGRGTIGKFATDSGLYTDLRELSAGMKSVLAELQKNPGKLGITVKVF
jgi:phospholipid/cholesterol/gamma-HCH transport system substrate-binding protein